MSSSRFARAAAVLVVTLALPALVFAQNKNDKKQQEKEQQAKRAQYLAMAKLVDSAMAQAPAQGGLKWASDFSLKAQENKTYVPFTVTVDPGTLNAGPTVVYLRVVEKGATAPAVPAEDKDQKKDQKPDEKGGQPAASLPPFEDLHTVQMKSASSGQPMSLSRAFAVPAGDYDVYVALAEQTGQPSKDKAAIGRTAVLKHTVTIPNYWGTDLTTTPIMLAEKVEQLTAPLSQDEQLERPYVLGNMEIVPAPDHALTKKDELSLLFLIYNVQVNDAGKPDLEVNYNFNQKTGDTEKFFNKTQPQLFNATTLPAQFDVRAGHQVVGGQTIPLASFPEGEYRLEIKINDKLANKSITRDVTFTVTP